MVHLFPFSVVSFISCTFIVIIIGCIEEDIWVNLQKFFVISCCSSIFILNEFVWKRCKNHLLKISFDKNSDWSFYIRSFQWHTNIVWLSFMTLKLYLKTMSFNVKILDFSGVVEKLVWKRLYLTKGFFLSKFINILFSVHDFKLNFLFDDKLNALWKFNEGLFAKDVSETIRRHSNFYRTHFFFHLKFQFKTLPNIFFSNCPLKKLISHNN